MWMATAVDQPMGGSLRALGTALRDAGYDEQTMRATAASGSNRLARGCCRSSGSAGRSTRGSSRVLDAAGLESHGLVRRAGGGLVPLVRIDEINGAYVCADLALDREDAVAPVSRSTRLSAAFTPRVKVGAALDLCAGSGAHGLLAARDADRVVATDVSVRALELARVNAVLNGVVNLETRAGSFLEPVAGERFDLVVANPPYVISPDRDFLYRDSGLPGDELSRVMLSELPGLLREGGYGCLQGNWIHGGDEPWYGADGAAPSATLGATRS